MKIVSVGGGPAGLHAATLLKEADPSRQIEVLERGQPDITFGFGVVFSDPTLDVIAREDPTLYAELTRQCRRWDHIEVRLGDRVARSSGQGFSAISRKALLELLRRRATSAGVELRFDTPVADPADLGDVDLIVVADGAGSAIRSRFAKHFKPVIESGATKFIWFGTTQKFDCLTFLFEENEHGAFSVHAYPFSDELGTFIVETDEASWRNAGLDHADANQSIEYCEKLFARQLGEHRLLSNQSRWLNFRTVSNESWRHRNMVLIGDAAHTAHFSVGSGTKLALEDAIALGRHLERSPSNLDEAYGLFEAERRAAVQRIQASAAPSLSWWENFRRYMSLPVDRFMFHFLTRNRRVTRASLGRRDPALVSRAVATFASPAAIPEGGSVTRVPLRLRELVLPGRLCSLGPTNDAAVSLHIETTQEDRSGSGAVARAALVPIADAALAVVRVASWADVLILDAARPTELVLAAIHRAREAWPTARPLGLRLVLEDSSRWRSDEILRAVAAGCDLVWFAFEVPNEATDSTTVLASDRIRNELGIATLVTLARASADELDTMLIAGRADLFVVPSVERGDG